MKCPDCQLEEVIECPEGHYQGYCQICEKFFVNIKEEEKKK